MLRLILLPVLGLLTIASPLTGRKLSELAKDRRVLVLFASDKAHRLID